MGSKAMEDEVGEIYGTYVNCNSIATAKHNDSSDGPGDLTKKE